jgi:hypothetical protein
VYKQMPPSLVRQREELRALQRAAAEQRKSAPASVAKEG